MVMGIITYKAEKIQDLDTLLILKGVGDLEGLFEYNLPTPNNYKRNGDRYEIEYILDGVFWTQKGVNYLNDIILRFTLTIEGIQETQTKVIKAKHGKKLREFQNLESIKKAWNNPNAYKFDDAVFWGIKLYVESYIKQSGEGSILPYNTLENYAISVFVDDGVKKRDKSTIRSKCRNIWNWYNKRGWTSGLNQKKYKNLQEYLKRTKMTRKENMIKLNKQKADNTKRKVLSVITGMFANEYKKKNGEWNIAKISKDIGVSRNSVYKYLQQL